MGLNDARCEMIKFRSMAVDAEEWWAEPAADIEHDGVLFKIRDDLRVTRVGRFLRCFSLDGLPQLFNLLRGRDKPGRAADAPALRVLPLRAAHPPSAAGAAGASPGCASLGAFGPLLRGCRPP